MTEPEQDLDKIVSELNRGLPGGEMEGEPRDFAPALGPLLRAARDQGASDLLLVAGTPAALRIGGRLETAGGPVLEPEETRRLLVSLLAPGQAKTLEKNRSLDFCFSLQGVGRFRANVHYQRGTVAGSIRLLPLRVPQYARPAPSPAP